MLYLVQHQLMKSRSVMMTTLLADTHILHLHFGDAARCSTSNLVMETRRSCSFIPLAAIADSIMVS